MTFDLAIIGAGPAGASAAITAARAGWQVALCERTAMRGGQARDKVCGEFVSAEALPLLASYAPGLLERAPVITHCALVPRAGSRTEFAMPQPARGLSRLALDAALWHAAGAQGAQLLAGTAVAGWRQQGAGFALETVTGETLSARTVLVASGRSAGTRPSPWLGVKARFHGLSQLPAVELYALRGGYCGLAPVDAGWTNVCCFLQQRYAPALASSRDFAAWLAAVGGSAGLCARLAGARQATPTVVTANLALGARTAAAAGALLAGDASGFVDPFTGDGIARALLSGRLAAEALLRASPEAYPPLLARAAGGGFRTAAALRRALAAPAWAQALACAVLVRPALAARLVRATRWHTL